MRVFAQCKNADSIILHRGCYFLPNAEKVLTYTSVGYTIKVPLGGIDSEEVSIMSMEHCERCMRTKQRTAEEERKLINRLKRIEGQIRGIRGMVEKNAYCPDILVQSAAAAAALNAFNRELLSEHIRTCVTEDIRQGKEETVDELLSTLQKLMR